MQRQVVSLSDFWPGFVEEHWEKRPGVFRAQPVQPVATCEQAFAGVLAACAARREGRPSSVRFFRENGLIQSNLDKYLPSPADSGFGEYAQRIAPLLGGEGFGLVVNGFAAYDFELFVRAQRFLRGLYEHVGLPGDKTDMDVFVGNYRHTPFGVHMDEASNFSMVLQGRKKFLLWPEPVLRGRRDTFRSVDLDPIREQAIVLEAEAGDLVYWPSSYWHIAESGGELSAVLNLALYIGDKSQRFVESVLAPPGALPSATVTPAMLPWDPTLRGGAALPASLESALAATSRVYPPLQQRRRAVLRAWLSRTSCSNFYDSFPPLAPTTALEPAMMLQGDRESPMLTLVEGERLICAAHGHLLELPALPCITGLLERLETGTPCSVEELVRTTVGAAAPEAESLQVRDADVVFLLQKLLAMRAIQLLR